MGKNRKLSPPQRLRAKESKCHSTNDSCSCRRVCLAGAVAFGRRTWPLPNCGAAEKATGEQKSPSLPVLPDFLEVPLIGQTQPEVRGQGDIVDTVHRAQLPSMQNRAEGLESCLETIQYTTKKQRWQKHLVSHQQLLVLYLIFAYKGDILIMLRIICDKFSNSLPSLGT